MTINLPHGQSGRRLSSLVIIFAALIMFSVMPNLLKGQELESKALPIPPILEPERRSDGTLLFRLVAAESEKEFYPGVKTPTLGYNGDYLGPTIRASRGNRITIRVENTLSKSTTAHWHGAHLPAEADGGPHQGIRAGKTWDASFTVNQLAATLWYHPHFMGNTAKQVYEGLAGMLIIDDAISDTLGLPENYGVDDIPVILQERRFDSSGRFSYKPRMPDFMHGYFGNAMLVNGELGPYKEVPAGIVRLRLLNGSNSTILRLSFDGIERFHQIASDGGFLEEPISLSFVVLSPGERAEVLVDFSQRFSPVSLIAQTNANESYQAMEFRPSGSPARSGKLTIPTSLVPIERIPESRVDRTRRFVMEMRMGGRFTINGKEMNMRRIDERVALGSTEIWEIQNGGGRMGGGMMGGMMNQPHSFHLHDVQFLILDINGERPPANLRGWKDTVLLWPGDRLRFVTRFDDYTGLYMYHCHLLEHEDNGMMGQFLVE